MNLFRSFAFASLVLATHALGQGFVSTGALNTARYGHTATLLSDGRVLVAAGAGAQTTTKTELYDPTTGSWSSTGNSLYARVHPVAVRLGDGRVLMVGGSVSTGGGAGEKRAEIYDPASGLWSATGTSSTGDSGQSLTLLPDGKALLTGYGSMAELYDPASGTWTATGPLLTVRTGKGATLLPNGKVLVSDGSYDTLNPSPCELFDPATGVFSETGSLAFGRSGSRAALLANGEVLLAGGSTYTSGQTNSVGVVELYSVAGGTWRTGDSLASPRSSFPTVVLPNGRALAIGGIHWTNNHGEYVPGAETYDPATATWSAAGQLARPRQLHSATVLADGAVLIVGGVGEGGAALAGVELYDATAPTISAVSIRSNHPGAPALAWAGDTVTVSFAAAATIYAPSVTLLGQTVTPTEGADHTWSASAVVPPTSPTGAAAFAIAFQNSAGRNVTPVRATTDGTSVTLDTVTAPPTTSIQYGFTAGHALAVSFNLPEAPRPGSVKLLLRDYYQYAGPVLSAVVLGPAQEVAGNRTLTFDPTNPTAHADVVSGVGLGEGVYIITVSYQDAAGNPAATVTLPSMNIDLTAPVITGVSMSPPFARTGTKVTVSLGASENFLSTVSGTIGGLPVQSNLTGYGPSATVTLTDSIPEGPLSFSLTVTDKGGNVSAAVTAPTTGAATVVDRTPPVLTVPPDMTLEATGAGGALPSYQATVTDNADPNPRIIANPPDHHYLKVGTTTVILSAFDAALNSATGTFHVTVVDTTKPTASVPPVLRIAVGGNGRVALGDLRPYVTRSDLVGVTSVVQTPLPGSVAPLTLGDYEVTFDVMDAAGNTTTVKTIARVTHERPLTTKVTVGARSGQPAPSRMPEGTILGTFGVPALSDFRDLATKVTMRKGRTGRAAILMADGLGTQRLAAYVGQPVAGIMTPGVIFSSFRDPVVAPSGAVTFIGTIQGPGVHRNSDEGVWTEGWGGALQPALREGHEVPGVSGARLKAVTSLSARDGGLLASVILAPAPPLVTAANDAALVLISNPGEGRVLLREGKPLKANPSAIVQRFSVLQPALGSPGQGRFDSDGRVVASVTLRSGEVRIVRIDDEANVTTLLSTKDPAARIDPDARWKSFGLPAMDPTGSNFVVLGTLRPLAGVVTPYDDAVLLATQSPDAFAVIAREGELITGDGDGPQFASFFDPVVNGARQLAFLATLRGNGVTAKNAAALLTYDPAFGLETVARLGLNARDETGAATEAVWSKFISHALPSGPGAGLIFLAETSGGDTTPANKQALWAVDSTRTLRRVLRIGEPLETDGPKLRSLSLLTAARGSYGTARSYNAMGTLAVQASFEDGSQAVLWIDLP